MRDPSLIPQLTLALTMIEGSEHCDRRELLIGAQNRELGELITEAGKLFQPPPACFRQTKALAFGFDEAVQIEIVGAFDGVPVARFPGDDEKDTGFAIFRVNHGQMLGGCYYGSLVGRFMSYTRLADGDELAHPWAPVGP